jgi:ATP-dependent Clp protease protease subunit
MNLTDEERELLNRRIVSLTTKDGFTGNEQRYVSWSILYLNMLDSEKPIMLDIDSNGGRDHAQYSIIDAIMMSAAPVYGRVLGFAGSSAFNILQFCDRRIMYRNADLMFHKLIPNKKKGEDGYEEEDKQAVRKLRRLAALISLRSGQPIGQLLKWAEESRIFSAKESLELGLADEIVPYVRKIPSRKRLLMPPSRLP